MSNYSAEQRVTTLVWFLESAIRYESWGNLLYASRMYELIFERLDKAYDSINEEDSHE